MNTIENAVQEFHNNNLDNAEKIALEILNENASSREAIDVLAAIYLKIEKLDLLENEIPNKLAIVRQIAMFLEDLQMFPQSIVFYQKALELDPTDSVAYNNLGLIYEQIEEIDNAKEAYEKSLEIKNNYPAAYNLGVLHRKLKNLQESEKYLIKAIMLKPTNPYANYSLGMTYLMGKQFGKGYPYFICRPIFGKENFKNIWDGKKYPDKKLLVFCEYGLGDAVMFSRYLPYLKEYFKDVVVCCPSSLIPLFQNSFPEIKFVNTIVNLEYDYSTFIMDLPYRLKMKFDNIPSKDEYLKVDEQKVNEYKQKYFNNDKLKVGIFYVGGELEKRNAQYRAIELKQLEKLFTLNNCEFYSFQKDDPFEELKDFPEIIDLGKTFKDFTDTAAAMKNIDVMVTIDSVPVHLAGALGIRTLLMLPKYSEWRWFTDTETTPWYNSVELTQQTTACDWQTVVDEIYNKLSNLG